MCNMKKKNYNLSFKYLKIIINLLNNILMLLSFFIILVIIVFKVLILFLIVDSKINSIYIYSF